MQKLVGNDPICVSEEPFLTLFVKAARQEHTGVIEWFLGQPGVNVNCKDRYGNTPLTYASCFGKTESVRLLLSQPGIDVNAPDSAGRTALAWASSSGHIEIVQLLLDQSEINVNYQNRLGQTPLTLAKRNSRTEIVQLLLEHGGIERNDVGQQVEIQQHEPMRTGQFFLDLPWNRTSHENSQGEERGHIWKYSNDRVTHLLGSLAAPEGPKMPDEDER